MDDLFDQELASLVNFSDETKPKWDEPKQPADAAWTPVRTNPTDIQRIVKCAKSTVTYGCLSVVLFWWQQAGLLASEAAWPSFIILALLAGLKIGSCMSGKEG